MKSKIVVCALFTLFATACLPAYAQTINTNGVCENDIPAPNNCLPNDEYNQTFIDIFGQKLGTVTQVALYNSEQQQTTYLPIVSNNGTQIDVCLALGSGTILPTRDATLSLLVGTKTVASIEIGEIDPYTNGSGFHPPITLRNCVTLGY
jgi:hypothetical protein